MTRRDFIEEDYETTIWDGEQFLFRVSRLRMSPRCTLADVPARISSVAVGGIP